VVIYEGGLGRAFWSPDGEYVLVVDNEGREAVAVEPDGTVREEGIVFPCQAENEDNHAWTAYVIEPGSAGASAFGDVLAEHFFVEEFPAVTFGEVASLRSSLDAVRVGQRLNTAGEMMGEPVVVKLDDSLHDAFVRIHAMHAAGLPVVDGEAWPVAYLDLMTLALLHREESGSE
jgi:hypothetical protein